MVNSSMVNRLDRKQLLQSVALGLAALGLGLLVLPVSAHAANNCPWINEATASGLLGSDAIGTATGAGAGQPGTCTFVSQHEGTTRTLRINVEVAADPHARLGELAQLCGTDAANLPAIGNEAVVCTADDRKGGLGERVLGRVRDQVFTITISSTQKRDPVLNRSALKTRISTAAEQVSGNLF
jgi:hypothetical protein